MTINANSISFDKDEAKVLLKTMVSLNGDDWVLRQLADICLKGGKRTTCDAILRAQSESLIESPNL